MNNDERAKRLQVFSDAIHNKYSEEEIMSVVSEVANEVKQKVGAFIYVEMTDIFNLSTYTNERSVIFGMSNAMTDIIDIACSIPETKEHLKEKNSVLFKLQVIFKAASDYFKNKYSYSPDCERFEATIKDAIAVQHLTISTLMLKKFFPNEDIEDIFLMNDDDL